MTPTLQQSPGLLVLPRLRIHNANAISAPLTHGFPSITAFLGFMWALERRLADTPLAMGFQSVGVVCHAFHEQTIDNGYVKNFRLTRNPVGKDGGTAAIVEEGRMHLTLSLVLGVDGDFVRHSHEERQARADGIGEVIAGMRLAGGSVFMSSGGRQTRPTLEVVSDTADDAERQFRSLRRRLLPGFALVARDDLLQQRIRRCEVEGHSSPLDVWLDLSRFNWHSRRVEATHETTGEATTRVEWNHDRTEGWIVPIPVGYGALSDLHEAGSVRNARDQDTPFRFVESLYSIGQWIGPHRLSHPDQLLWYAHSDDAQGVYRCRNDYARSVSDN